MQRQTAKSWTLSILIPLSLATLYACSNIPQHRTQVVNREAQPRVVSSQNPNSKNSNLRASENQVDRSRANRSSASVAASDATPVETLFVQLPKTGRLHKPALNSQNVSSALNREPNIVRTQSKTLADALTNHRLPTYCLATRNHPDQNLCPALKSYFSSRTNNPRQSRTTPAAQMRNVPILPQHFRVQQSLDYARLRRSLVSVPSQRVLSFVPAMLEHRACPRNLSAATIRFVEPLLPSTAAKNAIEKLYVHASACLRRNDPGYEITHFRQALLYQMWNEPNKALSAIQKAVLATQAEEPARVLYWAGRMQRTQHARDEYWKRLAHNHPLSFHALLIQSNWKSDPYLEHVIRPPVPVLKSKQLSEQVQLAITWAEVLSLHKHNTALNLWTDWIFSTFDQDLDDSTLLYLTALRARSSDELNQMTFLNREAQRKPRILNQQTMQLIFPRRYADILESASRDTDSALVFGITKQESAFNPNARSHANARGLMQVLPTTAQQVTKQRYNNLYAPKVNANIGSRYLADMIRRFGSTELAVAAYNAGPSRIDSWKRRYPTSDQLLFVDLIPFEETRNYVSAVLRNNYWYSRLYSEPNQWHQQNVQKSQLISDLIRGHTSSGTRLAMDGENPNRVD